jgi:TetR/AcrR family tetracycline transcriptional repressor
MAVKRTPKPTGGTSGRRRGRPAVLSRDLVLAAALRLVDEQGIERLTMRRLGAELGVDPMAIYHYLPDKSALFDGLIGRVFAEVEAPPPTGDWKQDLTALGAAFRQTLLAHANALPLLATRPPITEAAFELIEAAIGTLRDGGFSEQDAADGVDCLGRLVIGHALAEAATPPGDVGGGEVQHVEAQRTLPPERFPHLAAVERANVSHDPGRLFSLALEGLILSLGQRAP